MKPVMQVDTPSRQGLNRTVCLCKDRVVEKGIYLLLAHVLLVEAELLKGTASDQETHAVRSRVVGQTNLEAVLGELMSVGSSLNDVTRDRGADDLHADILVRLRCG